MNIRAWQVSSWKPVEAGLREWQSSVRHLRHLGTSVERDDSRDGLRYGQIVWGGEKKGAMFGMAWDWREIMEDVVVMSDPMTVLTNVSLVDEAGVSISASKKVIFMNTAIYALPWQEVVCETGRQWVESMRMAA